ncbi:alpha/beta fold hydrolase [Desertihabitans aurantiacus]|uniref:alpha/beta fold hydrolase n=1 Tax=Desertihabitans aurantiacus TaxID=2282477 RepID=UPI0018E58CE6|nr:alpha/beta hydrolase [Desertihabitans aurantiacus]
MVAGSGATVDVYGEPDGAAIVLVPGVMADAAAWAAVAEQLEGWPTVAVVNRRGRHPSHPLPEGYGIGTEVQDAAAVLRSFSDVRTLFGWSYGGLVALHLANEVAVPHVVAYEPVMAPFGAEALPDLRAAHEGDDLDALVAVALQQVTGMPPDVVDRLRSQDAVWAGMRRLGAPLYLETRAINEAPAPAELATEAARVDLVLGGANRGEAPYGTSFEDVVRRTPRATVHLLPGQGHLAHLQAPGELAALISGLRGPTA